MKVQKRVLDVDTTLQGERVGMTIDESALSHIMSVLTDLYSDPELAVIREYSTNALDAHVEAGETRPIEVTTPTPLSPFFRVRDYGVGLDADGIRDIYSRYGTSTKRSSNDVVGMLGLGCKSALTYTDQFTLTGIKDGRMVQVSVSRDEDGSGSMTIVADEPTTLPNGVEVVVPAKRSNSFAVKAEQFFRYWEPGTVKVDGVQPERIDGIWLTDKLCMVNGQDTGLTDSQVVMGNVAYPWPDGVPQWTNPRATYYNRSYVVAFVDIGDVTFTPSREALQGTKQNRDRLAQIVRDVQANLNRSIEQQITQADSPDEAVSLLRKGLDLGFTGKAEYDGRTVSTTLSRPQPRGTLVRPPDQNDKRAFLTVSQARFGRKGARAWTVDLVDDYGETLWFDGYDFVEMTPYKRQKLDIWLERQGLTAPRRIVMHEAFTEDEKYWIGEVHDWADVEAIKVPKDNSAPTASGRPRGSYSGRLDGAWDEAIEADTIDTTKPLVWAHGNRWNVTYEDAWKLVPDNATVICLPENRIEKFKRDFPMAVKMQEYAKAEAKKWLDKQPKKQLLAAEFQRNNRVPWIGRLKADQIDDPELCKAVRLAQENVRGLIDKLSDYSAFVQPPKMELPKPWARYKLLECFPYHTTPHVGHITIYLNAAYAAERGS